MAENASTMTSGTAVEYHEMDEICGTNWEIDKVIRVMRGTDKDYL